MPHSIVKKLFDSIAELERSVDLAKRAFASSAIVRNDLLDRVNQYDSVLHKQRQLVSQLTDCVEREDWPEVTRHIKLINGLSSLIHEDARSLIAEISVDRKDSSSGKAAQ
ncbi:MAG: hypothetical protein KDD66_09430 [Bdellovibrionales bacterium]|nr:hypothetical protein [Bdellovibrionales bacterium]